MIPNTALPLVIGATGHRDLNPADLDALAQQVRGVLGDLRSRFPRTPLLLLTALAEGADRLIAEVAWKEGVAVVAVLPMSRQIYETDFGEASRKEFAGWLDGKVKCWFELPPAEGNSAEDIAAAGAARIRQYAQVGEYIARHSQMLIALWDGQPGKEGGTEQVFHYKRDGFPLLPGSRRRSRLEPVEAALLCHIVAPRRDKPRPPDALQRKLICSTGAEETTPGQAAADPLTAFWRIFAPIERFNRDAESYAAHLAEQRQQSRGYLLGDKEDAGPASLRPSAPESGRRSVGLRPLVERYTLADSLAILFQRKTVQTLWLLYALIFLAVLCMDLFAREPLRHPFYLSGYVAALLTAYWWYWWSRRRDDQNKYQDYRALAEGLRVQLFWRLAGLAELQAPVADHYLLKHATALDWVRNALRTASSSWSSAEAVGAITVADTPPAALTFVRERWIKDQADFFKKRADRWHNREKSMRFWSRQRLSALTVLFVAGLLLSYSLGFEEWFTLHPEKRPWLSMPLFVVSLLLLLAALLSDYASKMALAEQLKIYRRMEALYRRADGLLQGYITEGNERAGQDLIRQLVQEALVENGDWLLLHRDRPVDAPTL